VIVADTNLLVYLYLPGEHTETAERVLRRDAQWAAPVLWRSEFRNVLALYLRKGLLSVEAAVDAFREAEIAVQGREYAVETARALDLVQQSSCSAYDCEFVALAQELDVRLVTSDTRVLKSFPGIAVAPESFSA
jgi:predicted nucleic acid-binding protein